MNNSSKRDIRTLGKYAPTVELIDPNLIPLRCVGYGIFRQVYLVEDRRKPGQLSTLKFATSEFEYNAERLSSEVLGFRLAQEFRQDTTLRVETVYEDSRGLFAVKREFFPGQTLDKYQGALNLGTKKALTDTVEHLHSERFAGLDLNRENIVAASSEAARIVDLDNGRLFSSDHEKELQKAIEKDLQKLSRSLK